MSRSEAAPIDGSTDGCVPLRIMAVLLLAVPSSATIPVFGAIGFPAGLFALGLAMAYLSWCLLGTHDPRQQRYPTRWVVFFLWAASLASYVASQLRDRSPAEVNGADRWLLLMVAVSGVMLVASEGIRSFVALMHVLRAVVWAGAFGGFVALVQFVASIDLATAIAKSLPGFTFNDALGGIQARGVLNRVPGTTLHPIELGAVTALLLPLAIAVAVVDRHHSWWRRAVPVALIAAGVPVSVSRSAVLGLIVALLVFVVQVPARLRLSILSVVPVAVVVTFGAMPGLLRTLSAFFTGAGSDASITSRIDDYAMVEGWSESARS